MRESHGCDPFSAVDTLENFLLFHVGVVDDYVVANRVNHLSVVQKVNVIRYVSLKTRHKLRQESDVWSAILVAVSISLCLFIVVNVLVVESRR